MYNIIENELSSLQDEVDEIEKIIYSYDNENSSRIIRLFYNAWDHCKKIYEALRDLSFEEEIEDYVILKINEITKNLIYALRELKA